jgi:hypothetical protein
MMLLMPTLGRGVSNDELRNYQRDFWGMENGETCVIELSGLSAKSLKAPIDRISFRDQRIEFIKERIGHCESGPKLVVMYGYGAEKHWKRLSGCELIRVDAVRFGSTLFAFMPGPTAPGQNDEEWIDLGTKIAQRQ